MDEFKGFDTGKVWLLINAQIAEQGIERWRAGYQEKCDLLKTALENHNDGRMKNYLCRLFVHSDLPLLKKIMQQAESMDEQSPRDRGKRFKQIVQSMAADTN